MPDAPTNDGSTSGTADSGTPASATPSSATQGKNAPQDGNDEVTLERVRTAVEQYNNGEIAYEELLDLIRRYLAN